MASELMNNDEETIVSYTEKHTQNDLKKSFRLFLKGISLSRKKNEPIDDFLARATHLRLQDRKLRHINVDALHLCRNLHNLYLNNNMLTCIETPMKLYKLQELHLTHNQLTCVPNLEGCPSLQRLYLADNHIQVLSGLHKNRFIAELDISRQTLPPLSLVKGTSDGASEVDHSEKNSTTETKRSSSSFELSFDPESLTTLSKSLQVLKVRKCGLKILGHIARCTQIEQLDCRDNQITSLDTVPYLLNYLTQLRTVDFRGNPITKMKKYRDMIVMYSNENLYTYDNREINPQHRQSLRTLHVRKNKKN
eukprot:g1523.t1